MHHDRSGTYRGACGCGCKAFTPGGNDWCSACPHSNVAHTALRGPRTQQPSSSSSSSSSSSAVVQRHKPAVEFTGFAMVVDAPRRPQGKTCALDGCDKYCYIDPTGIIHDYCCRSHAKLDASKPRANVCKMDGCRAPCFVDAGKVHEFCSRTHAVQYQNFHQEQQVAARDRCQFPNCNKPRFRDADGNTFDYCGKTHAYAMCFANDRVDDNRCVFPGCSNRKYSDGAKTYDFCSRSHAKASKTQMMKAGTCVTCRNAPAIKPAQEYLHCPPCWMANLSVINRYHERDLHVGFLPKSSTKFTDLSEQFLAKWRHGGNPEVVDILVFLIPQKNRSIYYDYRNKLEARSNFAGSGLHPGNEKRRFHGTKQRCTLGRDGNSTPCTDERCNVCRIIRHSFLLSLAGSSFGNRGFGVGRFGRGLYFTSTSSKSHSYNDESVMTVGRRTTRSMFAVKVALGRGIKIHKDDPSHANWQAPPAGYDSVLGEEGQDLNYDECVVYDEAAVLPSYLIIYEH